jgi:hypothetical protein
MDLKLHRPHAACAATGRGFVAGEPFISALVRLEGRLDRRDYSAAAWDGPPDNTLAWWRSTYPAADADTEALAPSDVLLDVFEALEGRDDEAPLRYLLALELLRRRVMRIVEPARTAAGRSADTGAADLALTCRRRDREYSVRQVSVHEATAPGIEERLTQLLWSGGDA